MLLSLSLSLSCTSEDERDKPTEKPTDNTKAYKVQTLPQKQTRFPSTSIIFFLSLSQIFLSRMHTLYLTLSCMLDQCPDPVWKGLPSIGRQLSHLPRNKCFHPLNPLPCGQYQICLIALKIRQLSRNSCVKLFETHSLYVLSKIQIPMQSTNIAQHD